MKKNKENNAKYYLDITFNGTLMNRYVLDDEEKLNKTIVWLNTITGKWVNGNEKQRKI